MITPQRLALVLLLVALATLPYWIGRVGLYQYLGIEILVWGLYALSYNLLLGYTGLPSFGHGAYFGVGAYAFGLIQKHVGMNLWLDLAGAMAVAALAGAIVAAFISHRRGIYYALMTIAFCQIFWFVAVKWHSVTGGEDGLLNLKRDAGRPGICLDSADRQRRAVLFCAGRQRRCHGGVVAHRAFAVRPGDPGDTPERDARRLHRLQRLALQVARFRHLRRPSLGSPVRSSHWRNSARFPTS